MLFNGVNNNKNYWKCVNIITNLSEWILENLYVNDSAVLTKVLAQLISWRLPAETTHKQLVVRQIRRSGATRWAALMVHCQSAHGSCLVRLHGTAVAAPSSTARRITPVAAAIHSRPWMGARSIVFLMSDFLVGLIRVERNIWWRRKGASPGIIKKK